METEIASNKPEESTGPKHVSYMPYDQNSSDTYEPDVIYTYGSEHAKDASVETAAFSTQQPIDDNNLDLLLGADIPTTE